MKPLKIFKLLILSLFLDSAYSFADDIYEWQVYGFWATHSPSPAESCMYYANNFIGDSSISPTYEGVSGISGTYAVCHSKYWTGSRWDHINLEMRRFGSYCSSAQNYNADEGYCATTPLNVGQSCSENSSSAVKVIGSGGNCSLVSNLPSQRGRPDSNSCVGNPINLISGNKFQYEKDAEYLMTTGFVFSRVYNSIDGMWRHNYSQSLRIGLNIITFVDGYGKESYFNLSDLTTAHYSNSGGVLSRDGSGWVLAVPDNTVYHFDAGGLLIGILMPSGEAISVAHNSSDIRVTDSKGNYFLISEDASHQPLTLSLLRTSIQYSYDLSKKLTTVTKNFNNDYTTRKYTYDGTVGRALLTGITDERGVPFAKWAYDDQHRAIQSEHADGAGKISIIYGDTSTTVINELGKKSIYTYEIRKGQPRIISIEGEPSPSCPLSNSSYAYDDLGLLIRKTDAKGSITTYTYNDRGLETTRTEASGTPQARVTNTEWDPTRFLRTKVVEPTRTTVYTYDDQGRETGRKVSVR